MRVIYMGSIPERPRGGARVIADHVVALRHLGVDAILLCPGRASPVPSWMPLGPEAIRFAEVTVQKDDVVVVPEDLEWRLTTRLPGRTLIFNQLAHAVTENIDLRLTNRWRDVGVEGVIVVDDRWRRGAIDAFGDSMSVHVVPVALPPERYPAPARDPERRILLASGKEHVAARAVVNSLVGRGRLKGWTLVEAGQLRPEDWLAEVARASIVVTVSAVESFGLVAAEAIMLTRTVVGLVAEPRASFWQFPCAHPVPWRDIGALVVWVEHAAERWELDPLNQLALGRSSRAELELMTSPSAQRNALASMVGDLELTAAPRGSRAGTLRHLANAKRSGSIADRIRRLRVALQLSGEEAATGATYLEYRFD